MGHGRGTSEEALVVNLAWVGEGARACGRSSEGKERKDLME